VRSYYTNLVTQKSKEGKYTPPLRDPGVFLRMWREQNPAEYDHVLEYQNSGVLEEEYSEEYEEAEAPPIENPLLEAKQVEEASKIQSLSETRR
jgi:hypothetical protein